MSFHISGKSLLKIKIYKVFWTQLMKSMVYKLPWHDLYMWHYIVVSFFYLIFVFVLGKLDEIDQKKWFPSEKLPTLKNTLGHGMQLPSIL